MGSIFLHLFILQLRKKKWTGILNWSNLLGDNIAFALWGWALGAKERKGKKNGYKH